MTQAFVRFVVPPLLVLISGCAPPARDRDPKTEITHPLERDRRLAALLSVGSDPTVANSGDPYDFAVRCTLGLTQFSRQARTRTILSEKQLAALIDIRTFYEREAAKLGEAKGENASARQVKQDQIAASLTSPMKMMQVAISCLRARQA